MAKVYYNKLVRDKIQSIIEGKGESCEVRTITDTDEFHQELLKKVVEEAKALSMVRTKEEYLNEYTDLLLVLETLNAHLGLSEADIAAAKEANLAHKGGYAERQFLHWSDDKTYQSNESPQGIIA